MSNQIVGLFNHQYLWKETINFLDFLRGDIERKIASEATVFGWMWPDMLNHNQTYTYICQGVTLVCLEAV